MLQINNLNKRFADRDLFKDCSLFINENERIALTGINGSGKTTLFRMITGEEPYDTGELFLKKNTRIGFLPQEVDSIRGSTLLAEVMNFSSELNMLQKKIDELAIELGRSSGVSLKRTLKKYEHAQSRFEELGGYDLEFKAKKILMGLGFKENDFPRPTDEFSGGWLMRIALAKLLLNPPGLMLLDEPTNHLDLESLVWLQNYLAFYKGALIFTSHDRAFINRLATRVVDIDEARLINYHGNYDYYIQEKTKQKEILIASHKTQERKIAHAQKFIDRFRATASRAKLVQSKIKALDKMEKIEIPKERKKMRFHFPQPSRCGYKVMILKDIHKSYEDNKVYQGIDITIYKEDKIALIGANGAGKSTLLKILAGVLNFDKGSRTVGHNVNAGYYPQHRLDILNPYNTCLAEIEEVCLNIQQSNKRKLLGRFLFSDDDVYKKVSVLRGGEKSRLILVKILSNPPNFLLMDEPINHLDIPSRDILIEALKEFTGAMCFISHDEYFIEKVANKIIEVKDGKLYIYPGGYDYYRYKKSLDKRQNNQVNHEKTKSNKKRAAIMDIKDDTEISKNEKALLKKKITETEEELSELSSRLDELNGILSDPKTYEDKDFISLNKELKILKTKEKELLTKWEQYYRKIGNN